MSKKNNLILFIFTVFFVFSFATISAQIANPPSPLEIQNRARESGQTRFAQYGNEVEQFGTPQQKAALNIPQPPTGSNFPKDTFNCFDYYHFGSVQTTLTAQSFNFNPGDTITFSGPITNQNDYPIVDGQLYIKILRSRGTTKDINGPDVVDQFVAIDNITIPTKGKSPVSFSWKVPTSLSAGEYKIASFFTVAHKFNLLGLSFTNDVIGNTFDFNVSGTKSNVQFDEAGVAINNSPYFFAAFPPNIPSQNPAIVSAKINNSTNKDETVDITWKLYSWDSADPSNLIRTATAKATIKANSSNNVQITIPENTEPVYYLVGELNYKDSKSILDIRFVRPENDKLRINFPSIMSFPIKKGANSTMFSCLYHSGNPGQSDLNGKLVLNLANASKKTIATYTYDGPITGMMAVKKDFVTKSNLDHFFLTAQIFHSDKLVDQATLEYDCNKIDSKLCNLKNESNINIYIIIGIIILLAIIISAIVVFVKRKQNSEK
ncbi:MAG: hypothetical protein NT155_01845 [Candidatus Staskawiczbacteria bacterium]|nr:hypothetical protein [Candidatus Staskawiczbacteria bacterium]